MIVPVKIVPLRLAPLKFAFSKIAFSRLQLLRLALLNNEQDLNTNYYRIQIIFYIYKCKSDRRLDFRFLNNRAIAVISWQMIT